MNKKAQTLYPIHPILAERWSPRAFSDLNVSDDDLGTLMEAARWAASCFNEQPWRFIITRKGSEQYEKLASCLVEANRSWAVAAPVLMMVLSVDSFSRNGKNNAWAPYDTGLAVGNLSAQATHLGLSLHQMAGFDAQAVQDQFSLPTNVTPIAAIALGHRGNPTDLPLHLAEREQGERQRRALKEQAFLGTWGAPFPFSSE